METVNSRPVFTAAEILNLLAEDYGLRQTAVTQLPGERDQNFLVSDSHNKQWVLKVANWNAPTELLGLQNELLDFLSDDIANNPDRNSFRIPRVKPSLGDLKIIRRKDSQGQTCDIRVVEYLPGKPLARIGPHSDSLVRKIGFGLGNFTQRMQSFDNEVAHREFHWDLANGADVINNHIELVEPESDRENVNFFLQLYHHRVGPVLESLRKSVIHADANDYNLIVNRQQFDCLDNEPAMNEPAMNEPIGLIDFGDVVHSHTVNELAICMAYLMLDCPDPITKASHAAAGFHAAFPMFDHEFRSLFPLACLRLCVSVCMSANQGRHSNDPYLSITSGPARRALSKLRQIDHRIVEMQFRFSCGLPSSPNCKSVVKYLERNVSHFYPVMGRHFDETNCLPIDLSVENSQFDFRNKTVPQLETEILQQIHNNNCEFGFGGYNEARLCYTSDQFRIDENRPQQRTVHLGIDIFAAAGTTIYCPIDASVHSFADNNLPLDYGPTIILKHRLPTAATEPGENENEFFTLYGHLSRDSLESLEIGQTIEAGEKIGEFGSDKVNGGWPAHLHFQIMTDMLGMKGDFPGACDPDQREIWLGICPDPNMILNNPAVTRTVAKNIERDEVRHLRSEHVSPSLSLSYREPLHLVRGNNSYLFDRDGRRYLDMVNNVCHVGHANERVVHAIAEQAAKLNTNTRYLHDNITRYSKRLCATLPDRLSVCFFVNSGSEANDLALRLARNFTDRQKMVCLDAAYHGHTQSLIDISPYKFNSRGGRGCPPSTLVADLPDVFRGKYRAVELGSPDECGRQYFADVAKMLESETDIAGVICESVLGCGGQIVLPLGYLQSVFEKIHSMGGVNICDEVQIGFGRVGTKFWGFELYNVQPDIVTMGKPIGNGHPLAAVVTTREIADAFNNGMEYFNTFGGNPVSCAAGIAVLDEIKRLDLQNHARKMGEFLGGELNRIKAVIDFIGDIRGTGLFWGIEFVDKNRNTKPAPELAKYVVEQMKSKQILLSTDGPDNNVIKIKPPMVITKTDLKYFLHCFETIAAELSESFQD